MARARITEGGTETSKTERTVGCVWRRFCSINSAVQREPSSVICGGNVFPTSYAEPRLRVSAVDAERSDRQRRGQSWMLRGNRRSGVARGGEA